MADKVYQVILYDTAFDHCFEYLDIHRTREGAVRQIKDMGYKEVHVNRGGEIETWYMESDYYKDGGTYKFTEVYDEPEATIKEYELMD